MQRVLVEASPFVNVNKLDERVREELYAQPFSFNKIANKLGSRPQKMFGFWESDNAYHDRLTEWESAEKDVLFEGWECKDMYQYQELVNRKSNIIITLEMKDYEVNYNGGIKGGKYLYPTHPETIDEFITDLKRMGITLFWKQKIADIYGIECVTSNKKIIDYYGYIKQQEGA
jgi:hypothetical protein